MIQGPMKGDVYRFLGMDCKVTTTNRKHKTVSLRDLDPPRETFKDVPWDVLVYTDGEVPEWKISQS